MRAGVLACVRALSGDLRVLVQLLLLLLLPSEGHDESARAQGGLEKPVQQNNQQYTVQTAVRRSGLVAKAAAAHLSAGQL